MVTRSISYGHYVASLLAVAILSLATFAANAQKLKFGIRSGVSLANYIGHNDSGPEDRRTWSSLYTVDATSFYDINGTRPSGSYSYSLLDLPNPYYKTSLTKDLRTGFYAGAFVEIRLGKRVSLEPGLTYVQKGIDMDFRVTTVEGSKGNIQHTYQHARSIQTDYISIPIVVRYYLDRKDHFYLTAGVYDAFAVKTRLKSAFTSTLTTSVIVGYLGQSSSDYVQWSEAKIRVSDCGLVGGFGFNMPVGNRFSLGIDARVNVGLVSVPGDSPHPSYLNFSSSTKNINLETGLRVAYALSAL